MAGETDSLHIRNLAHKTDTYSLQQAFPSASRANVVLDRETGSPRGFGFVTFQSAEMAKAELDRLGGPDSIVKIDDRDCKVNFAHPRGGGAGGGARRSGYGEYENNSQYPRQSEPRYGGEQSYGGEQHYGEQRSTGGYGGGQSSGRRPDRDYNSSGGHRQQY